MSDKIICPVCGAEYLMSEIFVPNYFVGQETNVQKDKNGKIISFEGNSPDWSESYRCDFCNSKFFIDAEINFMTTSKVSIFNKEYTTKVEKKSKLIMSETDE